jgi:hypothetical protein
VTPENHSRWRAATLGAVLLLIANDPAFDQLRTVDAADCTFPGRELFPLFSA